ncbi:MAG: dicarboxylate/amino acid:cation symporter [Succinivibrionaceae bacterium]
MTITQPRLTPSKKSIAYFIFFTIAIILGVINGIHTTNIGIDVANFTSEVFIRLFKFVSVPIIGISICTTIATLGNSKTEKSLWKRALAYTISTTVLSSCTAAILYAIIQPKNVTTVAPENIELGINNTSSYINYFINIVPNNILAPFMEGNVLSILLIAIIIGISIRHIPHDESRNIITNFLLGLQSILFFIVKWIINLLPIGIFGFVTLSVIDFKSGVVLGGLSNYFTVVVGSNLFQGLVVLPIFLLLKGINPLKTAKNMSKALIVAFCSKSSAATLPVTIACAEENNHINPKVSRFVLPICTTINMNGCAAFIFITVIYIMQNNGIEITPLTMISWIGIATIAAIGNAGVPMGCYFLSASLLSSMNVPIQLLGIILPIYAVIDMIETTLNVWSDSTVATMVNHDVKENLNQGV